MEIVNVAFKCGSSQQGNNSLDPFVWMCDANKNLPQIIFIISLSSTAQQESYILNCTTVFLTV